MSAKDNRLRGAYGKYIAPRHMIMVPLCRIRAAGPSLERNTFVPDIVIRCFVLHELNSFVLKKSRFFRIECIVQLSIKISACGLDSLRVVPDAYGLVLV